MRVINFAIYLAMYSGMIAAGSLLLTLGGRAAFNTYQLFQALEGHETISASGTELAIAAGFTPWLIIGGELVVGLVLLFYGLRGLIRRLLHGLPPPQEAAETPQARVGHALAYGAGAIAGGLLLVSSLINNSENLIPKFIGETTTARIIQSGTARDRTGYHSMIAYQFTLPDGSVLRFQKEVPLKFVGNYEQGAEIEIRYMRDNPSQHMFPSEQSYTEFGVRLAICVLLVVAGFAGVNRNLNYVEAE